MLLVWRGKSNHFLYETKNYLRDLLNLLRIFFSFNKIEASQFYDAKGNGESKVTAWSRKKFGVNDELTKLLKSEQGWIEQTVRMRDAVEHPGGWSGTLTVHNVRLHSQGFIPPSWSRTGSPESGIFTDMEVTMDNLLTIAEDLLVACIRKRSTFPMVAFYEIPEKDRNSKIPQRLKAGLAPDLERTLAKKAGQNKLK